MPVPAQPAPSDDIEDRDPGLARERTDLAWTRTAISFIALGTAMLRNALLPGVLITAVGATVWLTGSLSARSARDVERHPARRRTVRLITATTTLTAIVALASALLTPEHHYH